MFLIIILISQINQMRQRKSIVVLDHVANSRRGRVEASRVSLVHVFFLYHALCLSLKCESM